MTLDKKQNKKQMSLGVQYINVESFMLFSQMMQLSHYAVLLLYAQN